jgi:hypothetical protein
MEIGQDIFIKTQGNAARYSGSKIIESTITKVGRKYFEVEALPRVKFEIETMSEKTEFCIDYVAYNNKQEIVEHLESVRIMTKLRKDINDQSTYSLNYNKLKRIESILEE